jgi:hypothetical protein
VAEAGPPTLEGARGDEAVWAGRALGSADALVAAAPQQGHLLHMPSHTYLRWAAAPGLGRGAARSTGALPGTLRCVDRRRRLAWPEAAP